MIRNHGHARECHWRHKQKRARKSVASFFLSYMIYASPLRKFLSAPQLLNKRVLRRALSMASVPPPCEGHAVATPLTKPPKMAKRKMAVHLGYVGSNYNGEESSK